MSGIANKVKDSLSSGTHTNSGAPEGAHGTHNSRVANAADPRIDSDRDHRAAPGTTTGTGLHSTTGHTGTTGTSGLHSTTGHTGPTSGLHSTTGHTGPTGTSGLHSTTGHTGATGTSGLHSTTGHTGSSGLHSSAGGPAPNTDGPYKSDMMNKVDPRVDSDRDYSKNMGLNSDRSADPSKGPSDPNAYRGENLGSSGLHSTTGTHGTTTGHNTGHNTLGSENVPGTTSTHSGTREGTYGTHNSRTANAADPRIDSDLDGSRNAGAARTGGLGSSTTGTTGHHNTTGTTGHHNTTGTTGHHTSGTTGHNTTGAHHTSGLGSGIGSIDPASKSTGPAPNTAGPHKSDMLNKIDPRVDSNLDGSKTVGGDKTHAADRNL